MGVRLDKHILNDSSGSQEAISLMKIYDNNCIEPKTRAFSMLALDLLRAGRTKFKCHLCCFLPTCSLAN
jgi:hypothetical protein